MNRERERERERERLGERERERERERGEPKMPILCYYANTFNCTYYVN